MQLIRIALCTIMEAFALTGDWSGQQVRTTSEVPRRVSVIDVIKVVSEVQHAPSAWRDLSSTHPDVVGLAHNFKFPGQGQRLTPVTDARGLVTIVNLLPGQRAAQFRAAGADVLVRYLGGDATLVAEILANRAAQEALPAEAPARIFGEDVEARAAGQGLAGHQTAGVYIARYGTKLTVETPPGYEALGYGYTDAITRRLSEHRRRFGDCKVLDFFPTYNREVETLFQRYLRARGLLLKGRVAGETSEVIELFRVRLDGSDYPATRLQVQLEALRRGTPVGMPAVWGGDVPVDSGATNLTPISPTGRADSMDICDKADGMEIDRVEDVPVEEAGPSTSGNTNEAGPSEPMVTIRSVREFIDFHCELGKDEASARGDPGKCFRYMKRAAHEEFCRLLDASMPAINQKTFSKLMEDEGITSKNATWPGEGTQTTFFGIRKMGSGAAASAAAVCAGTQMDRHMARFLVSSHIVLGTSLLQNRAALHTAFSAFVGEDADKSQVKNMLEQRGLGTVT